jgi:hypothetical protein
MLLAMKCTLAQVPDNIRDESGEIEIAGVTFCVCDFGDDRHAQNVMIEIEEFCQIQEIEYDKCEIGKISL